MKTTIEQIKNKPTDYKSCPDCKQWNWYENKECINCGKELININTTTEKELQAEIDFLTKEELFTYEQALNHTIDV